MHQWINLWAWVMNVTQGRSKELLTRLAGLILIGMIMAIVFTRGYDDMAARRSEPMGQDDGFRIVELPPEPDPDEGVAAAQASTQADLSELPRSLWAGGREGQEALPHDSTARDMCSCGDLHQLWLEEPRMVGEQVQDLQEGLKVAGHYNGLADGVFGPGTDRAVRAFQARVGLPQDGIVDMEVWMAQKPVRQ